jgi:hypothetical protein
VKNYIYLVTRYGSQARSDGPDDQDTNFLVRAVSHEVAAQLVDAILAGLTVQTSLDKPVEPFCHIITQISLAEAEGVEGILHGPWVAHRYLYDCEHLPSWGRETQNADWLRT